MRKKIAVLLTALLLVLLCAWTATAADEREVNLEGWAHDAPLCKDVDGSWRNVDRLELLAVTGLIYRKANGEVFTPGYHWVKEQQTFLSASDGATSVRVYIETASGYRLPQYGYLKDELGRYYSDFTFADDSYGGLCSLYIPQPEVDYSLIPQKPARRGHVVTVPARRDGVKYVRTDGEWRLVSSLKGGQRITIAPGRRLYICAWADNDLGYYFESYAGSIRVANSACWKYARAASFSSPKGKVDAKKATVSLSLRMPGPGKVRVSGGKIKTVTKQVGPSGKRTVTIKAKKATIKKLRKQLRAHPKRKVATTRAKVKITWYPKSGSRQITYKTYTLKLKRK